MSLNDLESDYLDDHGDSENGVSKKTATLLEIGTALFVGVGFSALILLLLS